MASKKPFSLADVVGGLGVSNLDTPTAIGSVVDIPIECLQINELNFYDTSRIDELVKSIELNGLIEPIIVMPADPIPGADGPAYRIISGHRRFSAWQTLASEDPIKYAAIPAIVRTPANEIMEELLLIEANRATRVMSSADTAKQAERYKDLLVRLKEQGVDIPGRLRDIVSEAMKISASRLARLEVIRKGLIPEWAKKWEEGKLNESAAYELARISEKNQKLIVGKDGSKLTVGDVWDLDRFAKDCFERHSCESNALEKCDHGEQFWLASRGKSGFMSRCVPNCYSSGGKCCADCGKTADCKFVCKKALPVIEKKQKEARDRAEKEKLTQLQADSKAGHKWAKLVEMCEGCGVSRNEIAKIIQTKPEKIDAFVQGTFERYDWLKDLSQINTQSLIALSKRSGVSINKLLGIKNADRINDDDAPASNSPDSASPSAVLAGWRSLAEDPPAEGQQVIILKGSKIKNDLRVELVLFREGALYSSSMPDVELPYASQIAKWIPFPEVAYAGL